MATYRELFQHPITNEKRIVVRVASKNHSTGFYTTYLDAMQPGDVEYDPDAVVEKTEDTRIVRQKLSR